MTTMTTCVSLANGVLGPDLRVNYEYGLVLGVDEFRQEQLYLLEKDALHHRGLHGYGTVSGLHVRAEQPDPPPSEVLITVEPGLGIDQWGRPIVIRDAQCARLGAWLAKQSQADLNAHNQDGHHTVYVVARYDECPADLVPIAGQPCGSADAAQAASRLRDAPNIEFRWEPPAMVAWDAVRRFAILLDRVGITPGATDNEATIVEWVRLLDKPGPSGPLAVLGPGEVELTASDQFTLPAETAHAALDRIFTIWTTEVRPLAEANLLDPRAANDGNGAEAAILLTSVTVALGEFDPTQPKIEQLIDGGPNDEGRPYLLHTQLIQELLLLDDAATAAAKPVREFATLQIQPGRGLIVWLHHIDALTITPDALELRVDNVPTPVTTITPLGAGVNQFVLGTTNPIRAQSRVELRFLLDKVLGSGNVPLAATLPGLPHVYLGHIGGAITVFATEDLGLTREFVTITTVNANTLRAWFHTRDPLRLPQTLASERWANGAMSPVNFSTAILGGAGGFSRFWELRLPGAALGNDDFLGFLINSGEITANTVVGEQPLSALLPMEAPPFLGFDGEKTIEAFHAVDLPPTVQQPTVTSVPILPFVTITTIDAPIVQLWFHLSPNPGENNWIYTVESDEIPDTSPPKFAVLAEIGTFPNPPDLVPISVNLTNPTRVQHNVFEYTWREETQNDFLRFLFPLDANVVFNVQTNDIRTLRDLTEEFKFQFEGQTDRFIVAYHRLRPSF